MTNVSKGDLAYMVGCPKIPENNGVVVEVLDRADWHKDSVVRQIRTRTPIPALRSGDRILTCKGVINDSKLRRIAGPSVDIGPDTDIPIKAPVKESKC